MTDILLSYIMVSMILIFSLGSTILYIMIMKRDNYPGNWHFLYIASTLVNLTVMVVYVYFLFHPEVISISFYNDLGKSLGRPLILLYSVLSCSRAWILYFGPRDGK